VEALALLRLNLRFYPRSANAHDSYGEALAGSGDTASAIREYRAALRLDPKLSGSAEKLRALEGGKR
jgi:D-alanyl-D-alanine-carboxypeptidase/D-alanyl-D-alanine-endopeptidase